MRSISLSSSALEARLSALLRSHGPELVLDLRANAYGLGATTVQEIARAVGISRAYFGRDTPEFMILDLSSSPQEATSGWWQGSSDPVVSFHAEVISLKRVPADTPVSYGYHYRTSHETTLALICVGYADGVPRSASGKGHISLGEHLVPIAGRIAMDQCVLDIGDNPAQIGQLAEVWGRSPSLADWSAWSGRPEGALLAHVGDRVNKQWI